MRIPDTSHTTWSELVTGNTRYELNFVAAKIMLGRIMQAVKDDPAPEHVAACIEEIRTLFSQNSDNPVVQEDLRTLFGQEAV